MLLHGALTLVFGCGGSSDFWVAALMAWWRGVRSSHRGIRRLVIYLDNGPENSGRRTQFLKRMVQFADWSGLVVRLVYYPPYQSKYNPIERCWSSLEKKWNGVLLGDVRAPYLVGPLDAHVPQQVRVNPVSPAGRTQLRLGVNGLQPKGWAVYSWLMSRISRKSSGGRDAGW